MCDDAAITSGRRRFRSFADVLDLAAIPLLATLTLDRWSLHPAYRMTLWRRLRLVVRLYRNTWAILGPFDWKVDPTSVAHTREDFSGWWGYERGHV